MAKKKIEEVKENEELTEEVTAEVIKNEDATTTGETIEEVKRETKKTLVVNTSFNDKYTGEKYAEKTEFIVVNEDITTTKVKENQYKISAKRAEELKSKGYIN